MTSPSTTTSSDWRRRLHSVLGIPPTSGNELVVLRNGNEIFPAMLRAIDNARATVDIVTFVYWEGEIGKTFADRLAAAARRGCRVRVLLDAVGAHQIRPDFVESMTSAGCDVKWFRPIIKGGTPSIGEVNRRTHRKILVCDGEIAFTGGVGIADEWEGDARDETEWRDTHVSVRGPAVAGLQAAFFDNWADALDTVFDAHEEPSAAMDATGHSDCLVLRGSAEAGASDIRRLLLTLVQCAERRIRIASAYFNPDDELVDVLCAAVDRGVEVQLLFPGTHADKRFVQLNGESDYERLLDAGVDIRTYERSMMHVKVITVDGSVASIGSANLNERSTELDEECNLIVFDPDVVDVLDSHFDDDLELCEVLDAQRWKDRSLLQKVGETLTGAVDRWL
ncbi:MAG: cardiolipin synthase B [Ilumatobacter sp.]|nr:cardiolipin synthase B [Ilumatobacter sp.]